MYGCYYCYVKIRLFIEVVSFLGKFMCEDIGIDFKCNDIIYKIKVIGVCVLNNFIMF